MRPSIFLSAATICLLVFVKDAVATPNSENLVAADDENNERQSELQPQSKAEDSLPTIPPSNLTGIFIKIVPGNNGSLPSHKDGNFFDESSSVSSTSSISSASQVNSTGFFDDVNKHHHERKYNRWLREGLTAEKAKKKYVELGPMVAFTHPIKGMELHAYPPWLHEKCQFVDNVDKPACVDEKKTLEA
uniref:RxLR effector protein n=1 Tax=Peronospora matthiolae TaxID=2874970 RepID=A0AAV1UQ94_9STRA